MRKGGVGVQIVRDLVVRFNVRTRRKTANAFAMESEIVTSSDPIGSPLGKEEKLCARYRAGRWVIGDAIAIFQNDGFVIVRWGRGGGANGQRHSRKGLARHEAPGMRP